MAQYLHFRILEFPLIVVKKPTSGYDITQVLNESWFHPAPWVFPLKAEDCLKENFLGHCIEGELRPETLMFPETLMYVW